ncbi:glycosyltransferase [Paracoccus sediminicola]|uniref:glycosyltransferase n=1 Tax=Paracoccus sediminicola TaxID=3017783 RepID=UPI0022F0B8BD|nr:glycosyltransferase [Paracoccus sediminicola]WBU56941.1 glycosyltransferase [Paracoccus sediminicola]
MARICIGLGLYNGAQHLGEQLASIAAQSHQEWRLVVSDDGSSDDGPQIVRDFAARYPEGQVRLVEGPRAGATRNFLSLIARSASEEYLAFADQDDVWQPRKLARAIERLSAAPEAGVYAARTTICDAQLAPLVGSRSFPGPYGFRNALVQAVTAGNTCVLTPAAAGIARRAAGAAASAGIESHDWWIYQIVSGAGFGVIRDDEEVLLYRQHADNLKGRNDTAAAMKSRLGQLFAGDYGGWVHANIAALRAASDLLTPENRAVLSRFYAALGKTGPAMAAEFARIGVRRQSWAGSAALYAAALAGKLRRR